MSLHDVVIHLLRKGLPTSETERDELIASVLESATTPEEQAAKAAEEKAARKAELEAQLAELG